VDPLSWAAGNAYVTGDTNTQLVTVTSTGTGPLTVGTITITGTSFAKSADGATGQVIPAGESESLLLTFDPSSAGAKTGTLTIPNDAGADIVVPLTGTGVADPVEPPPDPEPIEVSRFYLGRQAAPAGVTIADSSWHRHTVDDDHALTIARGGPPAAWGTTTNLTLGQKTRLARWIGPPMAAQTVSTTFAATNTAAYRSSALGSQVTSALRFGIWRAATQTMDWQPILSMGYAGEPWRTSDEPLPRRMPEGASFSWTVDLTFLEGDRLVIEGGARGTNLNGETGTAGVRMRWGGESTALDVNTATEVQSTRASWIEFGIPLLVLP
jgi:hypothetical protein